MPQMSPMNWMALSISLYMVITLMSLLNKEMNKKSTKTQYTKLMSIKWTW